MKVVVLLVAVKMNSYCTCLRFLIMWIVMGECVIINISREEWGTAPGAHCNEVLACLFHQMPGRPVLFYGECWGGGLVCLMLWILGRPGLPWDRTTKNGMLGMVWDFEERFPFPHLSPSILCALKLGWWQQPSASEHFATFWNDFLP